jgi:diaminohydroxyphosphoribosylaminopyrimidine deaminase/5-amino-6-(5-phosphoribosylamino)uracil reductase
VIYAVNDPNPVASGGAQMLRDAGIKVEFAPSAQLEFAQRAWLRKEATGRPLMIWKVATTIDSKVAASDGTSQWISGPESREDVQKLRAQSDAILIGTNTALVDNPHLIPKGHAARPVRIISGEQAVPPTHKVFDDEARTVLVKSKSIPELISVLKEEKFNQVLVEAGPTLGSALMASGNIDELIVYQAPKVLGAGKEFVSHLGISTLADHIQLELISAEVMGSDIKSHYRIVKGR